MEQNHPEFPQLRCGEHKSPIILVNPGFKDEKNFFCAKCISLGQNNNSKNLIVYDEFISYMFTSSGINVAPTTEATQLAAAKKSRTDGFESHIDQEKKHITQLSTALSNQYQEKCKEMVTELMGVLEGQKSIFRNFYNRFEQEIKIDNENEASIPKFSEIKDKVSKMEDMVQIEQYLAQIVHQKEAWKAASCEIRTVGKRTEDYYRQQIENLTQQKPSFASKDQILQIWTQGLNDLIQKVKSQSGCFNNLFEQSEGVLLNIQNPEEVSLLTNQMIKCDTELVLNFSKKPLTSQEAQKLSADLAQLTNLKHLSIIFENNHTTTEVVSELSKALTVLNGLTHLNVNLYGNKLGDEFTTSLGSALTNLTQLQSLHFELGMNELTTTAVQNLVSNLGVLTHLKNFTFDAKYNKITDVSSLATSLSHFSQTLTNLNISFGGYAVSKNNLTLDSSNQLIRAVRQLTNLTNLSLDLGYTGLDDSCAIELSQSLKDLVYLKNINLQLYSNHIETRSAAKIVKRLTKIQKLTSIVINLNYNDKIRLDGAREIVSSFRQMNQLNNLDLNLVKVGVDKDLQANLKEDLNKNKLGSAFEKIIVLF